MRKHLRPPKGTAEQQPVTVGPTNPFLDAASPLDIEDPIVVTQLPTPTANGGYVSGRKYLEALQAGAHKLPWFFEFQIATSEDITFALKQGEIPAIRRVLVSVLGGRPMHAVANRVPISRSAVYTTLNRLYFSTDLTDWTDWGLVRIWDVPVPLIDIGTLPESYWIEKYTAPVVCLLCHRVLEHVPLSDIRGDFSIIETPRDEMEENNNYTERIRGHLIAHFGLFGRPPANERRSIPLRAPAKGEKHLRKIASRWIDLLEPTTVARANAHRNLVQPLRPDRQLSESEVRKFYRDLLKDPTPPTGIGQESRQPE